MSITARDAKVKTFAGLSSVSQFMQDIRRFDLLTADEERDLGERIAKGDITARNQLCDANYRLVIKIANSYAKFGVELADLIQAGCLGLIRAAEKFDSKLGYRFSTYSVPWIEQFIRKEIADNGKTIRRPSNVQYEIIKLEKAIDELIQKLGKEPNLDEIAEETGLTTAKLQEYFIISSDVCSLDMSLDEDDELDKYSTIRDVINDEPEEYVIKDSLRPEMEKAFSRLTKREAEVIKLLNGWDDEQKYTIEKLAREYNVTRDRIKQIVAQAMYKLRHSDDAAALKVYLE